LAYMREQLNAHNLISTYPRGKLVAFQQPGQRAPLGVTHFRTADGSWNNLRDPKEGAAYTRFLRNVDLSVARAETGNRLLKPDPREVSLKLLSRELSNGRPDVKTVEFLNLLAASWIQFMNHDWVNHGDTDPKRFIRVPLRSGDPACDRYQQTELAIGSTQRDPTRGPGEPARTSFINEVTHWWDGSQIYGSDLEIQRVVRTDPATGQLRENGKLHLDARGHLPLDVKSDTPNQELAGVNGNWWVGLSVMHTLFAREHNAIVDRLRIDYPAADGEWLFQKARLVNAALIAKIHTVEWTPALLNSPEGRFAMRGNFWGLLGEEYARAYGRLGKGEIFSGIPGSPTDHHTAPYAMTEEFTAVYRMHSLLPDEFSFRRHRDGGEIARHHFSEVIGGGVRELYAKVPYEDVVYSLATSNPGALVLHNYPQGLRRLHKKDDIFVDVASTDVLRDRERGVPRYRVSPLSRHARSEELRGAHVQCRLAARACRRLRANRGRRSPGRHALRGGAARVRLFRYGLPHLHPDGIAAAQERSLLHQRFHSGDLYACRLRMGAGQ
jgi:Animal haem peroxidase